MLSNKSLKKTFNVLNDVFFNNEIPDLKVTFEKIKDEGLYRSGQIIINRNLREFSDLAIIVLLHEMAHAHVSAKGYTGFVDDGHNIIFYAEIDRLYKAGAYEGLI